MLHSGSFKYSSVCVSALYSHTGPLAAAALYSPCPLLHSSLGPLRARWVTVSSQLACVRWEAAEEGKDGESWAASNRITLMQLRTEQDLEIRCVCMLSKTEIEESNPIKIRNSCASKDIIRKVDNIDGGNVKYS